MSTANARAIRANRRAQGELINNHTSVAADSSIDGVDLQLDGEPDIGEDSDSEEGGEEPGEEPNPADQRNNQGEPEPDGQDNQVNLLSDNGESNNGSEATAVEQDDPQHDFDQPAELEIPENISSSSHSDSSDTSSDSEDSDASNSSDSDSSNSSLSSGSESSDSSESSDNSSLSSDDERSSKKRKKSKRANKKATTQKRSRSKSKKLSKGKGKSKQSSGKEDKRKKKKGKSSKKSKKRTEIQIEIGSVPTGDLVQLQPFWADQMIDLQTSIPLTVFDQSFASADKEEYNSNHHSSSSKIKSNKGLDAPSKYYLSFGEWSECMSLFRRYLAGYYGQKPLAKRLKLHIENVKAIKRSTECWMTALRYDILCRSQVFVKRDSRSKMKDMGTLMTKYENQAKDKSLLLGEANKGNTNPYVKGGRLESRHPETGSYRPSSQPTASTSRAGPSNETQHPKRKRGKHSGSTINHQAQTSLAAAPTTRTVQHQLPANPMFYQTQKPLPPAAPMAANRFPVRGGRGGWRGGRGGFQKPRNDG